MRRSGKRKDAGQLGLTELIAMGVGGMIGGGIFSVLGLAVGITGPAAPLAFGLGSLIALAAGYSYIRLALAYRSDGASFTYLDRAFPDRANIAGIAGWTVVVGYIGTLALYAFTFGVYGADLLGDPRSSGLRMGLSAGILVFFTAINLIGTRASGISGDVVVYAKIALLAVFAGAGLTTLRHDLMTPVFENGLASVFMAGALIFVAFEGFQLITNAVRETRDPERNIPRAIYGAIIITSAIYIALAVVAVGNLEISDLIAAKEYALAVAATPVLGRLGPVLVGLAALLATSSAINATTFGAARMMSEMATQKRAPRAFSFHNRRNVPWIAVVTLSALALGFSLTGGLEVIAAFSSLTFLLVSIGVSIANLKLCKKTRSRLWIVLLGLALMTATVVLLVGYLWRTSGVTLVWIGAIYAGVGAAEIGFSRRRSR